MGLYGKITDVQINFGDEKIILRVEINGRGFINHAREQKEKLHSKQTVYNLTKKIFKEDIKTSTLHINF